MRIALCIAFVLSSALAANVKLNPLSDAFIEHINSKQSTWKAGRNFEENTPFSEIKKLLGSRKSNPKLRLAPTVHSEDIEIPDSFDAREQFPKCTEVIGTIADQSSCGSCWAVSVASAISDRRCIASDAKLQIPVSAEDLMSCCMDCGYGCNGGYPESAWNNWRRTGIVTGGLYNSSQGCKPYSLQTCDHHVDGKYVSCTQLEYDTPACTSKCTVGGLEYTSELTFGTGETSWLNSVKDIQREILQNGPVSADFEVYEDFVNYKSGVYQYTSGTYEGGHAVRIIGWGTENDVDYWLIANSWNEDWGDQGLFKILRGNNEVGIEGEVFGALPKV